MFNAVQPWHLVVLVIVILVLFGSKKLPDAARGLGRSLRILSLIHISEPTRPY